ncbi:MAG TPA: phenylalanine--tRNA ligase subunit alpha [Blastocatellia bacterium]|nr:phenylalanine--tRNA ligase subunit alpha [Blastocatellia bacterium]
MHERLDEIRRQFDAELAVAGDLASLAALHDKYLGRRSGLVTAAIRELGKLPPEERRTVGRAVNELKDAIEAALLARRQQLEARAEEEKFERERLDITLPGLKPLLGHLHPITLIRERIEDIFVAMGYAIEDGPEVETSYYNFDALNIPPGHPARESQDTFYLSNGPRSDEPRRDPARSEQALALRTQTSTVQIRALERRRPPLRIIAPGKVFRRDTPDPTHNPMFFQVEGLTIDRHISLGDLKGTLDEFVKRMFGPQTRTRFRPSYFPFTEPSAEVDFSCFVCGGRGCRICKGSGWIELGGSGMVHPRVLRGVGIDTEEFTGFAFGLGLDRMVGLMYGLDDIRLLYENDLRFLQQFG